MSLLVDEERREGGNITKLRQQKDTEEVDKMCLMYTQRMYMS